MSFSLILLSTLFSLSIAISIGNAPLNVNALSVRSMVKAAAPAPAVSAAAAPAVKIESNSNSNNNATVAKHAGMQTKGVTFGFKENPPFFALKGPYGPLKVRGNELVLSLTGEPGLDSFFEWVNGYQLRLVGTNSCLDSNSGTQVYLNSQCGANVNDNGHQNFIVIDNGRIQWRGDIRKPLTTNRCFQMDGRTDGAKLTMNTCTASSDAGQNFDVPAAPTFRIKHQPYGSWYIQVNGAMANGKALTWGAPTDTDGSLNPTFNGIFEWYNNVQLRLFSNNYCLDNNGRTEDGSPVYIWNCSPGNANQFFLVVDGNRIQKKGTNKCLDWGNGQLILRTCGGESPYQIFELPAPSVFTIHNLFGEITASNGLYNGAPLTMMEANGDPNQLFEWVNAQQLRVVGSNHCLDTNGGTTLYLWDCSSTNPNQYFIPRPGHPYGIQWKNSNKCIISKLSIHFINGNAVIRPDLALRECESPTTSWDVQDSFYYPYYPFPSYPY